MVNKNKVPSPHDVHRVIEQRFGSHPDPQGHRHPNVQAAAQEMAVTVRTIYRWMEPKPGFPNRALIPRSRWEQLCRPDGPDGTAVVAKLGRDDSGLPDYVRLASQLQVQPQTARAYLRKGVPVKHQPKLRQPAEGVLEAKSNAAHTAELALVDAGRTGRLIKRDWFRPYWVRKLQHREERFTYQIDMRAYDAQSDSKAKFEEVAAFLVPSRYHAVIVKERVLSGVAHGPAAIQGLELTSRGWSSMYESSADIDVNLAEVAREVTAQFPVTWVDPYWLVIGAKKDGVVVQVVAQVDQGQPWARSSVYVVCVLPTGYHAARLHGWVQAWMAQHPGQVPNGTDLRHLVAQLRKELPLPKGWKLNITKGDAK